MLIFHETPETVENASLPLLLAKDPVLALGYLISLMGLPQVALHVDLISRLKRRHNHNLPTVPKEQSIDDLLDLLFHLSIERWVAFIKRIATLDDNGWQLVISST